LKDRDNFERKIDVLTYSIGHKLEDAIWWDKSNGAISIEAAQPDTLVKLDIINLDSPVGSLGGVRILDEKLIVDAELAFRHPRELGLHQDLTKDISPQDCASS
jgi:hypothetical protein